MPTIFPITEEALLRIYQGSTFDFTVELMDILEDPVDLLGYQARLQIRREQRDSLPLASFEPSAYPAWSALTTYTAGATVTRLGLSYVALENATANLNKDPALAANQGTFWTRVAFGLTSIDAPNGRITLRMEETETAYLNFETAHYDLDVYSVSERVTPLRGPVDLLKEITR